MSARVARAAFLPPAPLACARPSALRGRARPPRAAADGGGNGSGNGNGNVNVNRLKSQRSLLSSDKRDVSAQEVEAPMVRAGHAPRDLGKWALALEHTHSLVAARLLSSGALVGFARATSDRALNGTLWDVAVDPVLPDPDLMRGNLIKYIVNDLRRSVPGCSIALFAAPDDRPFFERLDFVADPDGITAMALFEDGAPRYL